MGTQIAREMEWAAGVRNELLDYRLKFDHESVSERGQLYRGVVQNAVKALQESDLRADHEVYLRALKELFPAWQGEAAVAAVPHPSPAELTAEQLVDRLLEKAPSMDERQRKTLAERLAKGFPLSQPSQQPPIDRRKPSETTSAPLRPKPVVPDGSPALQELRKRSGLPDGTAIDVEMALTSLLAVAEVLGDILKTARATWASLHPVSADWFDDGKNSEIFSRLSPYLSVEWKQNLARLKERLERNPGESETVSITAGEVRKKLEAVLAEDAVNPATMLEVLRGILELRLPHPTMAIALLQGGLQSGPLRFAQDHFHLFDWRRIEGEVKAVFRTGWWFWPFVREADGREFWGKYREMLGDHFTQASLSSRVTEALVSGVQSDPFCPPALREE